MIKMHRILLSAFLLILCNTVFSQIAISDIQGGVDDSPYNDQTVAAKGAVTGVYKDGYFIRDKMESWSGLYIYDPGRNPMPRLGDTILLTGLITEYYNWTEMKNISDFQVVSSGNPVPVPIVITAEEVGEQWESCLITVEDVSCTNDNLGYGEWEVEDQTGALVVNDLGVPYSPEVGQDYTITGNLSYSFEVFKIEPRSLDDILINAPVYFTAAPYASNIEKTEIGIAWSTNVESTTEVLWGFTPELEQGKLLMPDPEVDHSIAISSLDPATLIYVSAISVAGEDSAKSKINVFITASESSGEIRTAFNRTYTDLLFDETPELFTNSLADTIIKYIQKAEKTLDIAFYDFTDHAISSAGYSSGIAEAIEQAVVNGIQVRLITDADVADAAPTGASAAIPRLDIDQDGIMHHKFIIVDHESVDNSWILTGSTNPNYNNMILDFNNLITIQDQSLARAYLIEFNELWGSDGPVADEGNSRSGSAKEDNSPHQFNINGTAVELYFSPSDHTTARISSVITNSTNRVEFVMMAFTENVLGDAIVTASNNGSEIGGIIDYVEYSGSEFEYLTGAGLDILDYANPDGSGWPDGPTVHHKFAIVDSLEGEAVTITGSHNWTASAESRNDENTLIIHDAAVTDLYRQEYYRIRNWLLHPPVMPEVNDDLIRIFNEDKVVIDILENDVITGEFSFEIIEEPEYGEYSILEDFKIEYLPGPDFGNEDDHIKYAVSLDSYLPFADTALVTIEVTPTGSSLINLSKAVIVYPNPANEYIYVCSEQEKMMQNLELIDQSGRVVYNRDDVLLMNTSIDVSEFTTGIYFLSIILEDGQRVFRKIAVE